MLKIEHPFDRIKSTGTDLAGFSPPDRYGHFPRSNHGLGRATDITPRSAPTAIQPPIDHSGPWMSVLTHGSGSGVGAHDVAGFSPPDRYGHLPWSNQGLERATDPTPRLAPVTIGPNPAPDSP